MIKRSRNKASDHIIPIYLMVFVVTFGRVWTQLPETYKSPAGYEMHYGFLEKTLCSFFGGIAWPLYWSVQMWS